MPIKEEDKMIYGNISNSKIQVLKHNSDSMIIVAPAGSGKSQILKSYVLHYRNANPYNSRILYLSFSKNVNQNFDSCYVECRTFHKLAMDILRENTLQEDSYSDDNRILLFRIRKKYPQDKSKQALEVINYHFNTGIGIRKIIKQRRYGISVKKLCRQIIELKQRNGLKFISQCLRDVVNMLSTNEDIRTKVRNRYDIILLDQAQDLNEMQYRFLKLIFNGKIVAVGDPFQSIYHFIGSSSTYMFKMHDQFGIQNIFYLNENYRSSRAVVQYANNFMNSLSSIGYQNMIPKKLVEGKVEQIGVDRNELVQTVNEIKNRYQEEQVTVLSFTNKTLKKLEQVNNIAIEDFDEQNDEWYDDIDSYYSEKKVQKFCTVHGFKGLQNKTIILVLDRNSFNSVEQKYNLFYTALTRAQLNLYVIKINPSEVKQKKTIQEG